MMTNAFTVDVEEHFQVAALKDAFLREEWDSEPSRVRKSTSRLLDTLAEYDVKGTFFVLGWVAEREPALMRRIADEGHELACHGQSHQLIYKQQPEEFREETLRAKKTLEDTTGARVDGYRAASYSITSESVWSLDILAEAGFAYDSSIVPAVHDIYGIVGAPANPYQIRLPGGKNILEFPPTTISLLGHRVPVGGGGYFRLFPYWFTRLALRSKNAKSVPFSFYTHPWEIDTEQPRAKVNLKSRFRHYVNLDKCEGRIRQLLEEFEFGPMRSVLADLDAPEVSVEEICKLDGNATAA